MNNYISRFDDLGQEWAVNRNTGEVLPMVHFSAPEGSHVVTPQQQRAYKQKKQYEFDRRHRRETSNKLGNFYFVFAGQNFEDVSAETAARLIYLATYLNYDGILMLTQRKQMHRSDLQDVMSLSRATTHRFWKDIQDKYVIEDDNGVLRIANDNIFRKGKLTNIREFIQYQKVYRDATRTLYKMANKNQHKHLGYVFRLLPFINLEWNIACKNPLEMELKNIQPLTIDEFCDIINYDKTNISRLLKMYSQLRFGEKNERFCAFVTADAPANNGYMICINPNIMYAGSDYRRVEVFGAFCK